MLVEHEKNSQITSRRQVIYKFFECSTNIPSGSDGPMIDYNRKLIFIGDK